MVLDFWIALAMAQDDPAPAPDPRDDEIFGPAEEPAPDPRDDEIFGSSDPEPEPAPQSEPTPAAPTGDRDEDLLGGGFQSTERALADKLTVLDDRFTIGGRMWVLAQANLSEGVDDPSQVTMDGPTRFDLYADARPNDRVRAYASGRLTHDWSIRRGDTDPFTGEEIPVDTVLLDQLWVKFDVAHRVYVTAGKQRIRWGTGRFWQPTDFLNQQRLDPLAIVDVRTGVDLVKVHVPIESANSNVYAIANLADAHALDEIGGALRAETSFGQTELTASAAARKDQPVKLGATASSGLGPFDVSLEAAVQHGVTDPRWEGTLDPVALVFPTEVDISDEWLVQVVGGLELSIAYGSDDSFAIGAQGFYNQLGYDDADLLGWLFLVNQYTPLYFGRAYAGGYVYVPSPGRLKDHTFLASVLVNVSDESLVGRFDWRATLMRYLDANAFVSVYGGGNGELHYSVEIPASGTATEPIVVPAPLATIGLSAIVRF